MQRKILRAAALSIALVGASTTAALADIKEYEFELVDPPLKQGQATLVVKVVHKPSSRAIPDAVIFAKRLDMGPDNMAAMIAPLESLPSDVPGLYLFKTDLSMAGQWALSLAAKVQGETGTLQTKLIVKVMP